MAMLLQRGVPTWFDFKISGLHVEFPLVIGLTKEAVPTHALEVRRVCLVLLALDPIPMEIAAVNNFRSVFHGSDDRFK
jgi:hypothetical protein